MALSYQPILNTKNQLYKRGSIPTVVYYITTLLVPSFVSLTRYPTRFAN